MSTCLCDVRHLAQTNALSTRVLDQSVIGGRAHPGHACWSGAPSMPRRTGSQGGSPRGKAASTAPRTSSSAASSPASVVATRGAAWSCTRARLIDAWLTSAPASSVAAARLLDTGIHVRVSAPSDLASVVATRSAARFCAGVSNERARQRSQQRCLWGYNPGRHLVVHHSPCREALCLIASQLRGATWACARRSKHTRQQPAC